MKSITATSAFDDNYQIFQVRLRPSLFPWFEKIRACMQAFITVFIAIFWMKSDGTLVLLESKDNQGILSRLQQLLDLSPDRAELVLNLSAELYCPASRQELDVRREVVFQKLDQVLSERLRSQLTN